MSRTMPNGRGQGLNAAAQAGKADGHALVDEAFVLVLALLEHIVLVENLLERKVVLLERERRPGR